MPIGAILSALFCIFSLWLSIKFYPCFIVLGLLLGIYSYVCFRLSLSYKRRFCNLKEHKKKEDEEYE